jgi:radical SAM superfamily enzyme YgiQ (UPF0313 family)
MKVCLVSAPTANAFEDIETAELPEVKSAQEHLPLGILSLAAVLQRQGIIPEIVDLNDVFYSWLKSEERFRGGVSFRDFSAACLDAKGADIYGFSTICSSYPLTLLLCNVLKEQRANSVIVLGGPQASSVDVATLESCPSVDLIIRGEAEETLPTVMDAVRRGRGFERIKGVSYRRGRRVLRNPDAPVIEDLDSLPFPAFHLHPGIKSRKHIPLEFGRGCPFACSFCSTSAFFRRRFRLKSPRSVVGQMLRAKETFNLNSFDLVHDTLTVSREAVVEFCQEILNSGETLSWGCSGRTDRIDNDLIKLMTAAGCYGIFFGVETGSIRMQQVINKRLDLRQARRRIAFANRSALPTSVSFIVGYPEETKKDLAQTVDFVIDCLRSDYAEPQVSILAPLAGTPLYKRWRDTLVFDQVISQLSFAGWRLNPDEQDFIAKHPLVFPNFYSPRNRQISRLYLDELTHFIGNGIPRFRWLLVALVQHVEGSLTLFENWRKFRENRGGDYDPLTGRKYYSEAIFTTDFVKFVKRRYLPSANGQGMALSCLVSVIEQLHSAQNEAQADAAEPVSVQPSLKLKATAVPIRQKGTILVKTTVDYADLIKRLKRRHTLNGVAFRDSFLVFRESAHHRSETVEITPLSAEILSLCNGVRSVRQIAALFEKTHSALNGIPAWKVCYFGLHSLASLGLLRAAR